MTTTTIVDRAKFGCPDWCTSAHTEENTFVGDDGSFEPYHRMGIGMIQIEQTPEDSRPLGCLGQLGLLDDLTGDELRQFAADALAAAEWLEAHR